MRNETKRAGVLRIPVATYRLQLNRSLRFADASSITGYLSELGITDIYASPYFKTRPGSLSGYDIISQEQLNPEIGAEADYKEWVAEMKRHGMGQLLDIVPNHMCILGENLWWQDVLENGKSSAYASYFDIDWDPVRQSLKDKVLLPVLGGQYGDVLGSGELALNFRGGAFFVSYFEHSFPVEVCSYEFVLRHGLDALEEVMTGHDDFTELMSILTALKHLPPANETGPERAAERNREKEVIKKRLLALYEGSLAIKKFIDGNIAVFNGAEGKNKNPPQGYHLLDELLSRQPYRLSFWKVATEEINYRRFFDINELAALRVEQPEVFGESHKLILRLVAEGAVTGLRVDHTDGLYNPSEYLRTLQRECLSAAQKAPAGAIAPSPSIPFYIVGEKILLKGERLPEDWPVYGTTGYDFMNLLNGIFIKAENARLMDEIYARFTRHKDNFPTLLYELKKLVMESSMSGEINVLGHRLGMIAEKSRRTRDFTLLSLTRALIEVMAAFPVYRTYITAAGANDRDRRYIELVIGKAKRLNPAISSSVFDFLRRVLLLEYSEEAALSEEDRGQWLDFVMRFQQQTGPVMAKGLEDTAFYVYNRLLSLNEVGGAPERFGTSLEAFHGQNLERNKLWPHALIATSTHDAKRSEDVRARINVLTEMPRQWREAITKWSRLNRRKKRLLDGKPVPDRNEEYHFYQTLLGVWPMEASQDHPAERMKSYVIKALREAKVNTSWVNPNTEYEDAFLGFVSEALRPEGPFLKEFAPFANTVARYGMLNSLSQVLLKAASPGVPDFYQGSELWFFFLVDPDNRREVDWALRMKMLEELKEMEKTLGRAELCKKLLETKTPATGPDIGPATGPTTGMIKLYVTWKALNLRRRAKGAFLGGDYIPIEAEGGLKEHICAFIRKGGGRSVLVAAPRFFVGLAGPGEIPVGESLWGDTRLVLPEAGRYVDVFTGREIETKEEEGKVFSVSAGELFRDFPLFLGESAGSR